jgi:predicted DNA-binding transcriptional regulator YafY
MDAPNASMEIDARSTRGQLLDLLRKGHALTQTEITRHLPIDSRRHARRLLNELRAAGVAVQEQRRGRQKEYYLHPSELEVQDLPVSLTERQALALVVAAEAGRAALTATPLSEPLTQGFGHLLDLLDRGSGTYELDRLREQWHFGTEPADSTFRDEVFDTLVEALNRNRPVRIEYASVHASDAPPRRTVSPLIMAAPGGSWRCVAYCHYREALRDFTLSRIGEIELCTTEVAADPPDDFDPDLYFRERFGALGGEPEVVRILVEAEVSRYFREKNYHFTQVIEEERDTGQLVVSFEVAGVEGMKAWIRSWGDRVTVRAPDRLATAVAEEAQRVADRYAD